MRQEKGKVDMCRAFGWTVIVACGLLFGENVALCNEAKQDDLLTRLRITDEIMRHLFLESIEVVPTNPRVNSLPRQMFLKFTRNDRLYAIEEEFQRVLADNSVVPPRDTGRRLGIGGKGSRPMIPLMEYCIFDGEKSAIRRVSALEYTKAGAPIKSDKTSIFEHVFGPEDVALTLFVSRPQWVLGRGYSERLTDLKEVESERDDGLLQASGSGYLVPSITGTWRLALDPTNKLLVREAEFIRDKSTRPMFRIRTSGILRAGKVAFAARGSFIQSYGRIEASTDFQHKRVTLHTNEQFFKDIKGVFDKELPVRSQLVDSRGKKEVVKVISPEKKKRPKLLPRSGMRRTILLISLGLFGVLLFIFFCRLVFNKKKKSG